jgi:hypothetical protein
MSTAMLLLLSGVMIGAGISLIWRDAYRRQRGAFVSHRDPPAASDGQPEVEITVSRRIEPVLEMAEPAATGHKPTPTPVSLAGAQLTGAASPAEPLLRPDTVRPSATALQWAALQPAIGEAVEQVNAILAAAGVAVGPPAEPSFSANRAFGADRHILIGGESVGSLRLQCTPDGKLSAAAKGHRDDLAEINADASAPASGLGVGRASDLLSECLKPTAAYATGRGDAEQMASERAWKTAEARVIGALKAGNGALAQAGARLLPLTTPAWDPQLKHHRMTVAVEVFGEDVARMHIDRLAHELEVSVGVPDANLADLGRRHRIAVDGMTTHALAELIASCAWPAIARRREMRPPA